MIRACWRRLMPIPLVLAGAVGMTSCNPLDAPLVPTSRVRLPPPGPKPSARLFAALATTLRRAERDLTGPGKKRPLFLAAATTEVAHHNLHFSLGQVAERSRSREQWVYGQVRMGTLSLDSAAGAGHSSQAARLGFAPDGLAVGRVLIPALKRSHRYSVKRLAGNARYFKTRPHPDRPADWTAAPAVTHLARSPRPRRMAHHLGAALRRASLVFRRYPAIQESWASMQAATWSNHTVTSESTRLYRDGETLNLGIGARTQASDGDGLELGWRWHRADLRTVPTGATLIRQATALAKKLLQLRAAPRMRKTYTGPVLFEDQAATALLLHTVGMALTANRASCFRGYRVTADGLGGQQVLPPWLTVVDDPTAKRVGAHTLRGHYQVDDEGIRARRLTLISRGTLRSLLGSRQPSRSLPRSNGRGRALGRALDIKALPSNLLFLPERPLELTALRRRYLALLKARKLDHGFIVRRLNRKPPKPGYRMLNLRRWLAQPTLVYRIDVNGTETLVRGHGAIYAPPKKGVLLQLVAMGGPPLVGHWLLGSGNWISVLGRAFILEQARLVPLALPLYQPPMLPAPLGAP